MGKRGPAPKPTALKVIEGNPSRRPLNSAEPRPSGEAQPPAHLTDEARAIWARIVGSMPPGLYTVADEPALAAFCGAVALHRQAGRELAADGRLLVDGKANPLLRVMAELLRTMATLSGRLGLSPADRTRLCQPNSPGNEPGNRWAALLASSRSSKD